MGPPPPKKRVGVGALGLCRAVRHVLRLGYADLSAEEALRRLLPRVLAEPHEIIRHAKLFDAASDEAVRRAPRGRTSADAPRAASGISAPRRAPSICSHNGENLNAVCQRSNNFLPKILIFNVAF